MKRRKAPRTLRQAEAAARRKEAETSNWTFFHDADVTQWGTFSGGTSFSFDTSGVSFTEGDIITISDGTTGGPSCTFFGFDPAYKPINTKRIHPARRKKVAQKQKELMSNELQIVAGGSTITCKKISNTEWKVMGEGIS